MCCENHVSGDRSVVQVLLLEEKYFEVEISGAGAFDSLKFENAESRDSNRAIEKWATRVRNATSRIA
jgi:hypothetical protein